VSPSPVTGSAGVPEVRVAPMRRRHLRAVLRIEAQDLQPGWSLGLFMSELARGDRDRRYVVARAAGSVVGFAGILFIGGDGHVTTISVDRRWRRRRVGTRLMLVLAREALNRGAEAMTLEVRAGNEAAIALYRRFGFAPVGVRKGYYRDPVEDALVMWATGVDDAAYAARLDAIEASLPSPVVVEGVG